jgi:hypothetical protein
LRENALTTPSPARTLRFPAGAAMNPQSTKDRIELTFALSRNVQGRSERVNADQMLDVFAAFERKLVGVDVKRIDADEETMHVIVAVRGGADQAYVERLWRRHLREHGLIANKPASGP